ncbi:MAG: arabinan endo-1,5-alpha-L-arabinosidase [Pedobacter sp.]|nr:MAG: arabinan endo-1,5-alpha-L-arabinosidase [Pedobacter sp.]
MKAYVLLVLVMYAFGGVSQEQQKQISIHDPVMIKQGNTFYLFATGRGINVWSSKDKLNWKREKPVFSEAPQWAINAVKGFKDFIWAPDIQFINGKYYLYYCVSMFGKNTSAIGVATNLTLDEKSHLFKWEDHGPILESIPGKTNWNAIDPNVFIDKDKNAWLSFGSFWGGIKLLKLNKDLVSVSAKNLKEMQTVATYKSASGADPEESRANAIEAPFIFRKGEYHYLFASVGFCCRGSKSTYRIIVGRSKTVSGPYLDQNGRDMREGGGFLTLQGNSEWYGVGHCATYTFDNSDYLVFHGYDAKDNARPKLRIEQINWVNGWPRLSVPAVD